MSNITMEGMQKTLNETLVDHKNVLPNISRIEMIK